MKRIFLSIFALVALSTSTFAQGAPLEWQAAKNTKVKIGGFIRFNINADFDGSVGQGRDFITPNIDDAAWHEDEYLNFDPSASRFNMEITQSTEALGDVKVFTEVDFRANSVRLRQAYITAKGFIAGQAWSFMTDLAANAPTVDINGVGSRTFFRTPLFGYRHNFGDGVTAGVALEFPSLRTDYIGTYCDVNQTVPNIPFYVQMTSDAGHIKVGGMIRSLQYGDLVEKERLSELGLGAQVSGSLKASETLKFYGQAIYGKGINNYISDLSGMDNNMMAHKGDMIPTTMGGASLGASSQFAPKWMAALSGSVVENLGDKDYFDGEYQSSKYMALSLFYKPAPCVQLGAELLGGNRTNFGGEAVSANRFSLSVKYLL